MANGQRPPDPFNNYNFLLEMNGITRGAFQEVSGLESDIQITEYREGGDNTTVRKVPGTTNYSNITLKRGVVSLADDMELADWHRAWVTGSDQADRRDGSIVLLDRKGEEAVRWNFTNSWPAKYTGPDFNATANEIAVETIELACEGIERVGA